MTDLGLDKDLENQEFLSVSDYRPTSTDAKTKSNENKNDDIMSSENDVLSSSSSSSHAHPKAAFFTVLFKGLAVGTYVFGSWFSDNFILIFVFTILCLACDFWTVKNVTGRLLVGLRWWNEVKDDGSSEWKFEAKLENNNNIND
eukprot:540101_1